MTASVRRIDHLVLAVRDLDRAAEFYGQIGFQVGGRNLHPWGTENRLVQMQSSFLELITVGEAADIPPHASGVFSFGAFVRDFLSRSEGLAMLVLDSDDAIADAAAFTAAGIGGFAPFSFERTGRRPDGSEVRVGFSLAFAIDPGMPDAGFFVCQQHHPDAFWNPAFQQHPNRAIDVTGVTITAKSPLEHSRFLSTFAGTTTAASTVTLRRRAVLEVEAGEQNRLRGYRVAVPDLDRVTTELVQAGIPIRRTSCSVTIPAPSAFGTAVTFVTTS